MAGEGSDDWRYERKFLLEDLGPHQVQSILRLHPALFRPLYHPRWVNNVYLDDRDLGNLRANVDGNTVRTKLRIRWYGALQGRIEGARCEQKIKRGLVGTKRVHPLPPFEFGPGFGRPTLAELLARTPDMPVGMRRELQDCLPVLTNRYLRRYFRSADRRFRITLDTDLQFLPLRGLGNSLLPRHSDRRVVILELKYARADDDRAAVIAGNFPFRLTKSSKYVAGLTRA